MTLDREHIKSKIRENLNRAGIGENESTFSLDIRVQPDYYNHWKIAVITNGFEGISAEERKKIVLKDLSDLKVEWLDLFTEEERKESAGLPIAGDMSDLPMWPEALLRVKSQNDDAVFPSDLDDDIQPPVIATFYSLRGGVGRSTALAYTAQILARRGHTVLCLDLDLEAPGLAALFDRESEIPTGCGIVPLLFELDSGGSPDFQKHLLRLSEVDELYCIPAGIPNADYARKLAFLDPASWYREENNPLRQLIDRVSGLSISPNIILLDSRTGITPMSGPLLFDLADLAIITFFPHPQSQTGTKALVEALLSTQSRRKISNTSNKYFTPEPKFIVSPIPASKAPEIVQRYRERSLEWINGWLSSCNKTRSPKLYIDAVEVTEFITYKESLATSDSIVKDSDAWKDYEGVADWISAFIPTQRELYIESHDEGESVLDFLGEIKPDLLNELAFQSGQAEDQSDFLETFLPTENVENALRSNQILVIGRKGTGKTAIFRRILEDQSRQFAIVISPSALKGERFWIPNSDSFKEIATEIKEKKVSWREFWLLQVCFSCFFDKKSNIPRDKPLLELPANIESLQDNSKFTEILIDLLSCDRLGLKARDWLNQIDRAARPNTLLVFDGLDTGFGSSTEERERRTEALEGLLSTIIDLESSLKNLRFKVLLRYDIYENLSFENKSHFYGKKATLSWEKRSDFFKVPLKQALRSQLFNSLVKKHMRIFPGDIQFWGEEQVFDAWNLLLNERMRGGKSAFTRNWVWSRLADAKDNRSPRFLLRLLNEALEWEKKECKSNPYSKSIIRPRALTESLPQISKAAADALLNEEFKELQKFAEHLKTQERSPIRADLLKDYEQEVNLAKEIGLIGVYDEKGDYVSRYKVPDLYLTGIGMKRSGQA
jgi:cellulose biosynthesis protein BcsQ